MKKSLLCILLVCVLLLGGCTPIYKQPSHVIIAAADIMNQCNSLSLWHYGLQAAGDGLQWIEANHKFLENDSIVQAAETQLSILEGLKPYTEDIVDRTLLDEYLKNLGADNLNRMNEMLESYESLSARLKEAFRTIIENGENADFEAFESLFAQYEKSLKNNKDICNEFYELSVRRLNQMNTKGLDKEIIEQCKSYTTLSASLYHQQQLVQDLSCCLMDLYLSFIDTANGELNPADYYQRYDQQIEGLTARLNAVVQQIEEIKQLAKTVSVDVSEYDQLFAALQQNLLQVNQINENFGAYINSKNNDLLFQSMDIAATVANELYLNYERLFNYHVLTVPPMPGITF